MPKNARALPHKVREILRALDDKKAEQVAALDLRRLSAMADFFVIASGNSAVHLQTLADALRRLFKAQGWKSMLSGEGRDQEWVLLDGYDVVVHLFSPQARAHYRLETLWGDARNAEIEEEGEE